jgi:hypothetical protein
MAKRADIDMEPDRASRLRRPATPGKTGAKPQPYGNTGENSAATPRNGQSMWIAVAQVSAYH